MKLIIPKCQCSFTLLTTECIVGGVTSRFLSQAFWIFHNKTRLRLYKRNLQSFKSAATNWEFAIWSIHYLPCLNPPWLFLSFVSIALCSLSIVILLSTFPGRALLAQLVRFSVLNTRSPVQSPALSRYLNIYIYMEANSAFHPSGVVNEYQRLLGANLWWIRVWSRGNQKLSSA